MSYLIHHKNAVSSTQHTYHTCKHTHTQHTRAHTQHKRAHTHTAFSGLARVGGGATGMVAVPRVTVPLAELGGTSLATE